MAEIFIERKERSSWPWIVLALLVVLALLWFFWGRDRTDRASSGDIAPAVIDTSGMLTGATADAAGMAGAPAAVNGYLQWFASNRAGATADSAHHYTATGVRSLADALDAVSDRDSVGGLAVQPRVDSLRSLADAMQRDAQSSRHAEYARQAFVAAGDLMQAIQQRSYPDAASQVSEARSAATSVQRDRPLLEQTDAVQRFFDHAGDALRTMVGQQPASS